VTVERDRTFPFAPKKKGVLRLMSAIGTLHLCQLFFRASIYFSRRQEKFFGEKFFERGPNF
jgi:hypothetical protein